jgi:hypothetical protein
LKIFLSGRAKLKDVLMFSFPDILAIPAQDERHLGDLRETYDTGCTISANYIFTAHSAI